MVEFLVEHGAAIPVKMAGPDAVRIATMVQRRQDWIDQAFWLAYQCSIPLTAIRMIHEFLVGFNWLAVREAAFRRV